IQLSIGASLFPKDADAIGDLLKRARTALWSRAMSETSGYCLYERRYSTVASRRFEIESAMRRGLDANQFSVMYQPKLDVESGRLVGVEALLRWDSPTLGRVAPTTFIPVAEESGLINELGWWILSAACQQMARWQSEGLICPQVAVNITNSQLRDP